MPPARTPDANVMVMLGQLLEATKTASEVIKQLGSDSKDSLGRLATIELAFAGVEEVVQDLNRVVRTGNGTPSLFTQLQLLQNEVVRIKNEITSLEHGHAAMSDRLTKSETTHEANKSGKNAGVLAVVVV